MDDKNSTCIICGNKSYGKPQCKNCWNLSKEIEEEIYDSIKRINPSKLTKLYNETLTKCKYNRLNNAQKKDLYCKLIAIGFIFEDEFPDYNEDILDEIYDFISNNQDNGVFFYKETKTTTKNKEVPIEEYDEIDDDTLDYRKKFPCKYRCNDGHYVRSKDERAIDDYLYDTAELLHCYEKKFRLTDEDKKICLKAGKNYDSFYPDFYIPELNLYIEYFGENEEKYNLKTELKIKIYNNHKEINFEYLTYDHTYNLNEKLEDIIFKYKQKNDQ